MEDAVERVQEKLQMTDQDKRKKVSEEMLWVVEAETGSKRTVLYLDSMTDTVEVLQEEEFEVLVGVRRLKWGWNVLEVVIL